MCDDTLPPAMIDAVLLDLDNTVCEYRRSGAEVLSTAFERAGIEPMFSAADYYEAVDEYADGSSMADIRERCFVALAEEAGYDPGSGRTVAREYEAERDHRNVRFTPGAREVIDSLRADHRLGLVTNGSPEMQREKLAGLGIEDAFEATVFAGVDAPYKPSPEPFRQALNSLAVSPERALHVGDSLLADVAGAHEAGLRSAWVPGGDADPDPDPSPDYVLGSLGDLREPPWR